MEQQLLSYIERCQICANTRPWKAIFQHQRLTFPCSNNILSHRGELLAFFSTEPHVSLPYLLSLPTRTNLCFPRPPLQRRLDVRWGIYYFFPVPKCTFSYSPILNLPLWTLFTCMSCFQFKLINERTGPYITLIFSSMKSLHT